MRMPGRGHKSLRYRLLHLSTAIKGKHASIQQFFENAHSVVSKVGKVGGKTPTTTTTKNLSPSGCFRDGVKRTQKLRSPLFSIMCYEKLCQISLLVSWCFEPSQPQRIISELKTKFNLSPTYCAHKSQNHKFPKSYKIILEYTFCQ